MRLAMWLCVVLAANPLAQRDRQAPPPAAGPIAVEVGMSATGNGGLLDLLFPTRDDDVTATERELASEIADRPWLQLARDRAEAAVAVTRCHRSVSTRSRSKDGKRTTITFRYVASAGIAVRGERDSIEAEALITHSYSNDYGRQEPTKSDDRDAFRRVGRDLAGKAREWLLPRVAALRPDGPDAGFQHRTRFRLLVKGDGLEVTGVSAGSPADRAGLRVGDRIRRVDKEDGTAKMDERVRTWRLEQPGTRVVMELERDRQRRTIEIALERPAAVAPSRR
jgi:hypothetical protein